MITYLEIILYSRRKDTERSQESNFSLPKSREIISRKCNYYFLFGKIAVRRIHIFAILFTVDVYTTDGASTGSMGELAHLKHNSPHGPCRDTSRVY